MQQLLTPTAFGVTEHEEFRSGQLEAALWAKRERGIKILQAPPGSGKTTIAKAYGKGMREIALSHSKFLQAGNYEESYGYDVLYGRSNYECVHPEQPAFSTAEHCKHRSAMRECPVYDECHYAIAKNRAQESDLASLNYPLWYYMRERWPEINVTVFDEAHLLPEIVIGFAGIEIQRK